MNYGKGGCECTSTVSPVQRTWRLIQMHACMRFALSFSPFLYFSSKRLRGLKVKSQSYDTPHPHKFCDAGVAKEGVRGKEEEGKKKKEKEGKHTIEVSLIHSA